MQALIMIGAFLLAGVVQHQHVGKPLPPVTDSQRVSRMNKPVSEFQDVVSTRTTAPIDIYADYAPLHVR